jgi:hypothetical protein
MAYTPIVLYDWDFVATKSGMLYCIGTKENYKEWETSQVVVVETKHDHYKVTTLNSVYHLYW